MKILFHLVFLNILQNMLKHTRSKKIFIIFLAMEMLKKTMRDMEVTI